MSDIEESLEEASVHRINSTVAEFTNKTTAARYRIAAVLVVLLLVVPLIITYHPFSIQQADELTNADLQENVAHVASYCDRIGTRPEPTEPQYQGSEDSIYIAKLMTCNPEAQKYFDQGMTLFYGFNNEEAVRYFQAAANKDVQCTMAHFGLALAVGSNVNIASDEKCRDYAKTQIQHAKENTKHLTQLEVDLIEAHYLRYSTEKGYGVKYRDAMASVYKTYSDNPDVAAIYVDSIIDLFPFAFWHPDGSSTNKEQTDILEAVLEKGLAAYPRHIGLNHFNIHVREGSSHPQLALSSAKLFDTMSFGRGMGHIVHMPAHVYTRIGEYQKSVDANIHAIAVDKTNTDKCMRDVNNDECNPIYAAYYNTHNLQFLCIAYTMLGQSNRAIDTAVQIVQSAGHYVSNGQPRMERYMSTHILTLERFQKWKEIVAMLRPNPDTLLAPMSLAMYHYAKAKAYIGLGDIKLAHEQEQMFHHAVGDVTLPVSRNWGLIPGHNVTIMASIDLTATFSFYEQKYDEAIKYFRNGVDIQDQFPYDEPIVWMPMRVKLGAALFHKKKYEEALKVFVEDLRGFNESDPTIIDQRMNPNYVYSAYGEYACLKEMGKNFTSAFNVFQALWNETQGLKEFTNPAQFIL